MKNQRGVSLFLIVIIMSVLMSVSLGLSVIIVGGGKISGGADDAIKAFYIADTGIERALYSIQTLGSCSNFSDTFEGGSYEVVIIPPSWGNCFNEGTIITSLGTYNGSKKKIEVSY
ncbi:MAG: hypothetical protein PHU17_02755 [Candidatus Pacebacteria bacterium]|nr:hypothetical protein [Candidatus Paceibacterota bacterium]MDD4074413.1 hypothetical protein [Candidatus Paceibacterota bacterium]